jgi:hypothetical protein
LANEISILRAVRETPDGQTGAPSDERACPVCSDEPVGDTTAGRICVIHRRYLVMTDCLQVKQQGGSVGLRCWAYPAPQNDRLAREGPPAKTG